MQIEYTDAINFLMNCDDAYILTHQSPDGDTIGSAFALCYLLKELGKRSKIICPDGLPERYNFMYTDYEEADFEPDCIIAVDIADPKLLGKYREVYGDKVNLCIDHHYSNILYAEKTLLNAHAGATCEIIYRLINLADIRCSDMMARCLYTGIATDTGCFKFENTTAETHRIVAEMMDNNHIEYAKINRLMFDIKSPARLKVERLAFDATEFYFDGKCAFMPITEKMLEENNITSNDLEGVATLPLQIEGVEVGVTLREREANVFKVSMRSGGKADVSLIAGKLGGGGHIRASGCLMKGELPEVRKKILSVIETAVKEQDL